MAVAALAIGAGEDWCGNPEEHAASVSNTARPASRSRRLGLVRGQGPKRGELAVSTVPVCTNVSAHGKVSGGSYLHVRGR